MERHNQGAALGGACGLLVVVFMRLLLVHVWCSCLGEVLAPTPPAAEPPLCLGCGVGLLQSVLAAADPRHMQVPAAGAVATVLLFALEAGIWTCKRSFQPCCAVVAATHEQLSYMAPLCMLCALQLQRLVLGGCVFIMLWCVSLCSAGQVTLLSEGCKGCVLPVSRVDPAII
jgi:hypothetical protein